MSDPPKILHKFLAVTLNPVSIFRVTDQRDADFCPIVTCLASRSRIKGATLPTHRMHNGFLVGVTRQGIILYREPYFHSSDQGPQPPTPIEEVSLGFHGDKTGDVVCLLPDDDPPGNQPSAAYTCFHANGLKCLDGRWEAHTKMMLELIGKFHPVFSVSKHPFYSFDYSVNK